MWSNRKTQQIDQDTIKVFKKQKMMKERVAKGLKTENPRTLKILFTTRNI